MSDPRHPDEPDAPRPGPGSVRPTGPGVLTVTGCLGLLLGYAIRPISIWLDRPEPVLTIFPVVIVWVLAVGVGVHAWNTWRALQRPAGGRRLEPHQAVNRLMLGKASAIVAALLLGGYLGFAVAHLFIVQTDLSQLRLLRGLIAAAGSLAMLVGGLALERACRVRDDEDAP